MISTSILVSALTIFVVHTGGPSTTAESGRKPETKAAPGPKTSTLAKSSRRDNAPNVVTRASSSPLPPPASTEPASQPEPTTHDDDEHELCGDEAVAAFNSQPDDPHAEENLLDAATCYMDAGLIGRAYVVYTRMVRDYPDGRHIDDAKRALDEIVKLILDPTAGERSSFAATCMDALRANPKSALATKRVAAAGCLRDRGLVAAALRQRQLAAPELHGDDQVLNAEAIAKLQALLASFRKRMKTTDDEGNRSSSSR